MIASGWCQRGRSQAAEVGNAVRVITSDEA
jgi:hypothetical protein